MSNLNKALTERSWQLLKLLLERYIEDGQPVGSAALAWDKDLQVSSGTMGGYSIMTAPYVVVDHDGGTWRHWSNTHGV